MPNLQTTLNREENPYLVKLVMVDENSVEIDMFFSGIVGEECTYIVKYKVVHEIGPDVELYEKYFDTCRGQRVSLEKLTF